MFFRVMCEEFMPDTAFYPFGRSSFGFCVNGLRLLPQCMRSDDVLSGSVCMVYASYRSVCVRTVFFPMMCHCFRDVLPGCPAARTARHGVSGCVTAQRSASGAPLAGMKIGTADGMGRAPKTPRVTGRASGVTCTPGWAVRLAIWSVR